MALLHGLRGALKKLGAGPILVHSDMFNVACLTPKSRSNHREVLQYHLGVLFTVADGREVWVPTFNYDFTRTGLFDVVASPSQVGPFSEFFRTRVAHWRTHVPVFSICGTGPRPMYGFGEVVDPFDDRSVFAELVRQDGAILFYGAPFSSATFIHYVERTAGGPLYRYDKLFRGHVILEDATHVDVTLLYHVRPMGRPLEYDWHRLEAMLIDSGILWAHLQPRCRLMVVGARALRDIWLYCLARDPLFLLNHESRSWVAPMLDRLGRRFRLSDFEGTENVGCCPDCK